MPGFDRESTCANCGQPIRGEVTGHLSDGPLVDWRHARSFTHGCGGRVDRHAPQAIPAGEATQQCRVHGKVTRHHHCPAHKPAKEN
jgi:hypothetical protein